jgi:hypothetical protein
MEAFFIFVMFFTTLPMQPFEITSKFEGTKLGIRIALVTEIAFVAFFREQEFITGSC